MRLRQQAARVETFALSLRRYAVHPETFASRRSLPHSEAPRHSAQKQFEDDGGEDHFGFVEESGYQRSFLRNVLHRIDTQITDDGIGQFECGTYQHLFHLILHRDGRIGFELAVSGDAGEGVDCMQTQPVEDTQFDHQHDECDGSQE